MLTCVTINGWPAVSGTATGAAWVWYAASYRLLTSGLVPAALIAIGPALMEEPSVAGYNELRGI